MARLEKLSDSGRFRAKCAAAADGTAGAWGDGTLINVRIDADGKFDVATATDCDGVVLVTEGRNDPDATDYKELIGGREYTVLVIGELDEIGTGTSPTLAEGDKVYAAAAGDVEVAAPGAGAIYIGVVMDSGDRFVLRVNGKAVAAGGS